MLLRIMARARVRVRVRVFLFIPMECERLLRGNYMSCHIQGL